MSKKIITYILLFSFLNYIGCTATVFVTVNDYDPEELITASSLEIYITTYDNTKYYFSNEAYWYFMNDTLFARGSSSAYEYSNEEKIETGRKLLIEGSLTPEEIGSIEYIAPEEIKVITKKGSELNFFNKGYYYIKNDTLHGQGKIQRPGGYEYFEGKIAVSKIKSAYSGLLVNGEKAEDEIFKVKGEEKAGIEVSVLLKSGETIQGQILSARDSSLILSSGYSAIESDLIKEFYPVISIEGPKINNITVEGDYEVWTGAGYGALLGLATAIGLGIVFGEESQVGTSGAIFYGTMALAPLGAILGGIYGYFISTNNVVFKPPAEFNFSILKPLTRYPDEEPEYLKLIK